MPIVIFCDPTQSHWTFASKLVIDKCWKWIHNLANADVLVCREFPKFWRAFSFSHCWCPLQRPEREGHSPGPVIGSTVLSDIEFWIKVTLYLCLIWERIRKQSLYICIFTFTLIFCDTVISLIVSYFGYKSPQRLFRLSNKGLLEIIFTNGSRLFSFPGNQHHWEPVLVLTHHHPLVKKSTGLALLYTDT